ncbi:MAG: MFS transporter [Chloroflexota bacterium]|nr:MFS transporter [Chloroflexota bacterium]
MGLQARLLDVWRTPAGRGFVMLAIMSACFGLAMSAQENIVTNYFEDVLGLEGPQFGYITAIREVPGFLLIFLTAIFYRLSIQRLTALALVLLTVGYVFFGLSDSFWTVAPWVIISSMGYHTVMQTQYALAMSLTTEQRSGRILGQMSAISNGGAMLAMVMVLITFHYDLLSFRATFVIAGILAFVAAIAIFRFPSLHDGQEQAVTQPRDRFVLRKSYRFYYYLSLLDGGRQQIFFSFGLWVLVHEYGMGVPEISALLILVRGGAMFASPWIGRMVDKHGERQMLSIVNVAYLFALGGYALVNNVYIASACYVVYSFIFPFSSIGAATYLRKVAVGREIAPSLAMGVTLQHTAAIVVPVTTGFILNYVGFQVPFLIACGFAILTFFVTQRLDPTTQKSPARIAEEEARTNSERVLVGARQG